MKSESQNQTESPVQKQSAPITYNDDDIFQGNTQKSKEMLAQITSQFDLPVEKRKRYNLDKISTRLSMQPRRLMEIRNREMHEQVMHLEKENHNKDKSCPFCNELARLEQERRQRIQDEKNRIAREKYLKKLGKIVGDP